MSDRPTRRAVGAGAAALLAGGARAPTDPLDGAALHADLATYAGFGHHRTGTAGDQAVTRWLTDRLRPAGYAVETQAFDLPVFEVGRVEVAVGGRAVPAFPLWPPHAGKVTAPLAAEAAPGRIALVVLPQTAGVGLGPPAVGPVEAAVKAGAAAVVVINPNHVGELAAINALPEPPAWPVPVVLVAARESEALRAAAARGEMVGVRLEGAVRDGSAENVVARRPGAGKALVMSTPKSGWMTCAGERGSGVAIWLGLARWLAVATDLNLVLVATSGHEFDGHGGHLFTQRLAPRPADTRLWLHLGANVASYDYTLRDGVLTRLQTPQPGRLLACSHDLVPAVRKAFAGQPAYETPSDVALSRPPGEAAQFLDLGYQPLLALVGSHPLHHTPRDLPDVTDGPALERVARALKTVLEPLAKTA